MPESNLRFHNLSFRFRSWNMLLECSSAQLAQAEPPNCSLTCSLKPCTRIPTLILIMTLCYNDWGGDNNHRKWQQFLALIHLCSFPMHTGWIIMVYIYAGRTTHEKKSLCHSEKYAYQTSPGSKMWDISRPIKFRGRRLTSCVIWHSITQRKVASFPGPIQKSERGLVALPFNFCRLCLTNSGGANQISEWNHTQT